MPEWGHKFYMGALEGATHNSLDESTEAVSNGKCEHKEFDEMNIDEDGLWKHCADCKRWVRIKDESEITTELFSGDNPSKAIESTVNQLKETAESINKLSELLKPSEETAGQEIRKGVLDPSEIAREVAKTIKEDLTKE